MLYTKQIQALAVNDCSEDFVLPDYYPEIRRIMGVRCTAAAEGKYVSGDEIEADGDVTYTVLYTDGDGEICQVSETTQYTAGLPLKNIGSEGASPDGIVLDTSADGVVCRVTAPRKITLSSKVKTNARSTIVQSVGDYAGYAADGTNEAAQAVVRRKVKEVCSAEIMELRGSSVVEGEIRQREGMSLVSAYAEICASDVRISGGNVSVKGDAYAVVLLKGSGDGEKYVTAKSRVPVDVTLPIPERFLKDKDGKVSVCAFADVRLVEAEISDDGLVSWRAEYSIDADLTRSSVSEMTEDAYIPSSESEEIERAELHLYQCAAAHSGRITAQVSGKLKNIKPSSDILYSWGEGYIDKAVLSGGRMVLTGRVKIVALADCGGEIVSEEFASPLKYEAECEADVTADDRLWGKYKVRVCDVIPRVDGDEAVFSAEAAVSAFIMKEKSEDAVVGISPVGESAGDRAVITVYAADEGESQWDVEKKFRLGCPAVGNGGLYVI